MRADGSGPNREEQESEIGMRPAGKRSHCRCEMGKTAGRMRKKPDAADTEKARNFADSNMGKTAETLNTKRYCDRIAMVDFVFSAG